MLAVDVAEVRAEDNGRVSGTADLGLLQQTSP